MSIVDTPRSDGRVSIPDATTRDVAARRALAIAGVVPHALVTPSTRAALATCVRDAAAAGTAVVPLGLGAHRALGHRPARYDLALSTRALTRIVDYAPADMTVTVESGVTLAALQGVLAREGQWLPVDPPLPEQTTVGGLIAADLAGPLAASQGRVRDLVIGTAMTTADGKEVRAGGRVVKNVAGYDLMKLMIGSLGTLAVVTEATFKVRPRPQTTRLLVLTCADRTAALALASRLAELDEVALAITLLDDGDTSPTWQCLLGGVAADVDVVTTRIRAAARAASATVAYDEDGAAPGAAARLAVARDVSRTAADVVVRAATLRTRVVDLAVAMRASVDDGARVRARVDPRAATVTLALETADAGAAIARLRAVAAGHGATLVVERWPDALAATIDVWSPLPPALPLMRRVKAALDPAGVLAPGRFVGRI